MHCLESQGGEFEMYAPLKRKLVKQWKRMEGESAGLPRLWPVHVGLARDGLYVPQQFTRSSAVAKNGVHLMQARRNKC